MLSTFEVRDVHNYLLARVINNDVDVKPEHTSQRNPTDSHRIIIENEYGDVALMIYFMNASTIKISGDFYAHGHHIVIDENGVNVDHLYTLAKGVSCYDGKGLVIQ